LVIVFQQNGRVIIFSELLNACMEKPYHTHLLSSVYIHHVNAKVPALTYSFHELGAEATLVRWSLDQFNRARRWHNNSCGRFMGRLACRHYSL